MDVPKIGFTQTVTAPLSEVWLAFTNSTALREWLADVAVVIPEKGGRLYLGWNNGYQAVGVFEEVADDRLSFSWQGRGEPAESQVAVRLAAVDGGTRVRVFHGGITGKAAKRLTRLWKRSLENLASVMETGRDLRFTHRPMLGVNVDVDLSPERAQSLGVGVRRGVVLGGVDDGMGAAAAGLAAGDVITRLAGQKVTGWPSLATALDGLRAGDEVEVVFHRGPEKITTTMKLSGRPIPDVPDTAAALADLARHSYAGTDALLASAIEGVGDEEASRRPSQEEWSAKEVLAHLLTDERDSHQWIAQLVMGVEPYWDGFGNSTLRVKAVADTFPDPSAVLEELRRLRSETVLLLSSLPDEFVARKRSFWRMAYDVTQDSDHVEGHVEQITRALAAARS